MRVPPCDAVLCLGDVLGYYCQVNEVIDTLRAINAVCIRGNHDQMVLDEGQVSPDDAVRFGIEVARRTLTPQNRSWLAQQPLALALSLDGYRALLVHGSPWDPLNEYVYSDSPRLRELESFQYDAIAWGHTHRECLIKTARGRWLINPGSVGQSRTHRGYACGVLLSTRHRSARIVRVPYPAGRLVAECERLGAGLWVRRSLGHRLPGPVSRGMTDDCRRRG